MTQSKQAQRTPNAAKPVAASAPKNPYVDALDPILAANLGAKLTIELARGILQSFTQAALVIQNQPKQVQPAGAPQEAE